MGIEFEFENEFDCIHYLVRNKMELDGKARDKFKHVKLNVRFNTLGQDEKNKFEYFKFQHGRSNMLSLNTLN